MMGTVSRLIGAALVTLFAVAHSAHSDVERRAVDIWSDGTRMSGDLWLPENFGDGDDRPALLLTHGWGGLRAHLNAAYAPKFVQAGFVVLTFDYRGWADSDSRLILTGRQPSIDADGTVTVTARAIREVVDPIDQVRDILSALDFLSGEPGVDAARIGLWGTSYSGGHVVYVGANDDRIAAIVSQVGYFGVGWTPAQERHAQNRAIQKARGAIAPIPQGLDTVANLRGTPDLAKMRGYRPIQHAGAVTVPTLIIDAEDEELFDRTNNGLAAYNIIRGNVEAVYETYPGRHYDIYGRHLSAASDLALHWFQRHLMKSE